MSGIPYVGKRLTPEEFDSYAKGLVLNGGFNPQFVVVHNTGAPTLAGRPQGFTSSHMLNLASYYGNDKGWDSGPHIFCDDNGIWLFSPIGNPGTHSPSWNGVSFGIELLGDFDTEDCNTGRGAKVKQNGLRATAALLRRIGKTATNSTIKFHKEDPKTNHKDCPGKSCVKSEFVSAVSALLAPPGWEVVVNGKTVRQGIPSGEMGTGLVRDIAESLGASVGADGANKRITLVKAVR